MGLAEAVRAALSKGVQSLIVISLDVDRTLVTREMSQIAFGNVPAVCILAGELHLPLPHVFYDNRSGGYQAAQHLPRQGWNGLTVVAPFTASWVTERIAGVRDAVAHAPSPPAVSRCWRARAWTGTSWAIPARSATGRPRPPCRSGWRSAEELSASTMAWPSG